jgi:AcrR family transcriptional regulator
VARVRQSRAADGGPGIPGVPSRQAMLDASIALFADRGYDATGVQEIVDRANLTKGSFYYAFESKEDVLRQIQDQFIERCLAALDSVIAEGHPPDVALSKAIGWFIAISGEQREELSIFFQESRHLTQEFFADVRRKRDLFEEKFVSLLNAGQESGVFREVPSRIMGFGIIGMCAWAYHWVRPELGPTDPIGEAYADVLLNGLYANPRMSPGPARPAQPES